MGAGTAPTLAYVSDGVSTVDVLARNDSKVAQMPVASGYAVAMVNDYCASVAAHEVGKYNYAVCRGYYRLPIG